VSEDNNVVGAVLTETCRLCNDLCGDAWMHVCVVCGLRSCEDCTEKTTAGCICETCWDVYIDGHGSIDDQMDRARVKYAAGKRRVTDATKDIVWERDGGACVVCGSGQALHYDHDIPFSKGGSNGPENIRLLCAACNLKKSNKIT